MEQMVAYGVLYLLLCVSSAKIEHYHEMVLRLERRGVLYFYSRPYPTSVNQFFNSKFVRSTNYQKTEHCSVPAK